MTDFLEHAELESDRLLTEDSLEDINNLESNQFIHILERILPHITHDEEKVISAQVILALRLEGVIGKDLSEADNLMIDVIKESIMVNPEKKESALLLHQKILGKLNQSNDR